LIVFTDSSRGLLLKGFDYTSLIGEVDDCYFVKTLSLNGAVSSESKQVFYGAYGFGNIVKLTITDINGDKTSRQVGSYFKLNLKDFE
jgi:hypothetical protein